MSHSRKREITSRVLVETLKRSKTDSAMSIEDIASGARTSQTLVLGILGKILNFKDQSRIELTSSNRVQLALKLAMLSELRSAARVLTWQEFEEFTEECLSIAGFETIKGVVITENLRRWQIDIVAERGELILVFDCKHWSSPSYPSKIKKAADHQKFATITLLHKMKAKHSLSGTVTLALPVILTLFDPRSQLSNDAVCVSVDKLPDFLNGITPYSEDLPFISIESLEINPIRQTPASIVNQT